MTRNDLIEFIVNYEGLSDPNYLFESIAKFLFKASNETNIAVFSLPSAINNEDNKNKVRSVWRKKNGEFYRSEKDGVEVLTKFCEDLENIKFFSKTKKSRKHYCMIPICFGQKQIVFSVVESKKEFLDDDLRLLAKFMQTAYARSMKWNESQKLSTLVHIDDVTGLFNQRKLIKDLKSSVDRFQEFEEPFCVLFIDIDHFKSVNDGHGHLVGTKLLEAMANLLATISRDTDLCYRYGGDEFVMILPGATNENGKSIGERILTTIKNENFQISATNLEGKEKKIINFELSVSIGVAGCPSDAKNETEILEIADRMMYEAKKSGRGQVKFTGEILGEK